MANWAQTRSGRLGVILHDDGKKYFVKPFDKPKSRENWYYSDVVKVLDHQDQMDRRRLGEKSKARARARARARAQERKSLPMSFKDDPKMPSFGSHSHSCPQCGTPPPSYVNGSDCPNCGYGTNESRSFKQYMMQFEWQGFKSRI